MSDKQYLSETILKYVLRKLEEHKQQSQEPINVTVLLQSLLEQVVQQG